MSQKSIKLNKTKNKQNQIIFFTVLALFIVIIIFICVASFITSIGYNDAKKAMASQMIESFNENELNKNRFTVIIDAGHGGEDPGAVANGHEEKDLNLEISMLVRDFLQTTGVYCTLTRNSDVLLYTPEQAQNKKKADIGNRLLFANNFEKGLFISVHMNKFPQEYCFGPQVFYSPNNEMSIDLATMIQQNMKIISPENKRVIKNGKNTSLLLERLTFPSVLVECAFLSNNREAMLLKTKEYKNLIALTIYFGICEYLEANYFEK